jgi:hypothetical protein
MCLAKQIRFIIGGDLVKTDVNRESSYQKRDQNMAGYYLHSLSWEPLHELIENPSNEMIAEFTDLFSKRLEQIRDRLKKSDVMYKWPTTVSFLQDVARHHFAKENWYQDLTSDEADAWESALCEMVELGKRFEHKFHGGDSIYWNAISEGVDHHVKSGSAAIELNDFGKRPFRYVRPDIPEMDWLWYPMHSMHTPNETKNILAELRAAEESIVNSGQTNAPEDYEVLCEMFDEIVPQERALYVRVDT